MATKPQVTKTDITADNAHVMLNSLRSGLSAQDQAIMPIAVAGDVRTLREIGKVVMDFEHIKNAYDKSLWNVVTRTIVVSKNWMNPFERFKKGTLDPGETEQEVYMELSKVFLYDETSQGETLFRKQPPETFSAYHSINYKTYYKLTIEEDQLSLAFYSYDALANYINQLIDTMVQGMYYDEFLVTKYMIAKAMLNGAFYPVHILDATAANMRTNAATIKSHANAMTFRDPKYNFANVHNFCDHANQYIFLDNEFDAVMDVEVLATSFNRSDAEFIGNRMLINGFGYFSNRDVQRLEWIFGEAGQPYVPFTADEIAILNTVKAATIDEGWFRIYDNRTKSTKQENAQDLYDNMYLHVWRCFSYSPFHNAVAYTTLEGGVNTVSVIPSVAYLVAGQTLKYSADVTATGIIDKSVTWSISGNMSDDTTIDADGLISVAEDETATVITVTATSVADTTKSGDGTLNITIIP